MMKHTLKITYTAVPMIEYIVVRVGTALKQQKKEKTERGKKRMHCQQYRAAR